MVASAGSPRQPSPMPEPPLPPLPERPSHRDLPVVLEVDGWRCLVVGGGPVAARRAGGLLLAGAKVTVVAPELDGAFEDLAGAGPAAGGRGPALHVERRRYLSGEAAGYRLVVTATGRPEVDGAVVADAVAGGVLVNNAAAATPGTVRFPAVHRAGPVTLAVSTSGHSPALAAWLRDRVAGGLPAGISTLAALVDEARTARRGAGHPTGSAEWAALFDRAAPLVEAGRIAEARAVLRSAGRPSEQDEGAG
jgi:precorrin-2 dehydrogenase / sirohydrochlorin ferrochelatase